MQNGSMLCVLTLFNNTVWTKCVALTSNRELCLWLSQCYCCCICFIALFCLYTSHILFCDHCIQERKIEKTAKIITTHYILSCNLIHSDEVEVIELIHKKIFCKIKMKNVYFIESVVKFQKQDSQELKNTFRLHRPLLQ